MRLSQLLRSTLSNHGFASMRVAHDRCFRQCKVVGIHCKCTSSTSWSSTNYCWYWTCPGKGNTNDINWRIPARWIWTRGGAWDCPQTCSKKEDTTKCLIMTTSISGRSSSRIQIILQTEILLHSCQNNCAQAQLWGSTKKRTRKKEAVTTRRLCYTCSNNSKEVWDDNQVSPTNHQGHEEVIMAEHGQE